MELIKIGWIPIHFWSKEAQKNTEQCVEEIINLIYEIEERDMLE